MGGEDVEAGNIPLGTWVGTRIGSRSGIELIFILFGIETEVQ